jgi:Na+:H+ antiporter, NhaC family
MEKKPNFYISLIPILILVGMIIAGVRVFGDNLTSGPSQIALLTTSVIVIAISMLIYKNRWKNLENGMTSQLEKTGSAIFILLMIGSLTATWMLSGIVPSLIYFGLKLIHPSIFLAVAFLLTSLVSLLSGSSWTTCGTIGVALISAGSILGIHEGWLAGAIISGAYFGDKRSPLSDSCNLSASVAGVDLYKHINYLLYTNLPSFVISLIVFVIVGFTSDVGQTDIHSIIDNVTGSFNISGWYLLIPCFTIFMIYKKVPPFITLFISALMGGFLAFIAQPQIISQIYGNISGTFNQCFYSIFKMMSSPVTIDAGSEMMNALASTKGMSGMMNTVWLILSVITFGGVMQGSGMINAITDAMIKFMTNTVRVVSYTIGTCIICNITLSDQYMSILLPGKMFAETYKKKGYAPELLSRTLEDSATVTSVLVPWNTCAVAQSTVLGVSTLTYLPFCIFNIISPLMSIFVAAINWKIHTINNNTNGN